MFEWNSNLEIGITEIDDQHRQLVILLNKLFNAMKSGSGRRILSDVFAELESYAIDHFTAEEALMAQYAYPEEDKHRAAHAEFKTKIETLKQESEMNDQNGLTIPVLLFLRQWLTDHIANTDQGLGDYLIRQNAS
jgi:hemerythrin-like metal-binding protein